MSRHLAAVVESADDAIFTIAPDGVVLTWNAGAQRLYGYPAAEIVGCHAGILMPAKPADNPYELLDALRAGRSVAGFDAVRRHRDGHHIDVHLTVAPICDAAGELASIAVVARDVTERLRMAKALADSERRYRQMFELNPHPTWVFDTETLRFLDVNRRAVEQYGYSREEFLTMRITDIRPPGDAEMVRRIVGGPHRQRHIWRHRKRDGTVIDVEVLSSDFELDGRAGRLVVATDVTERLGAERRLRELADRDSLTGVLSRSRLQLEIDRLLAAPQGQHGAAVVVFDIDHFKFVNDSFGHARGDELMRRVAGVLSSQLEPRHMLGRLGGDEFGLLLPDTGEQEACELASRLLARIRDSIVVGSRRITASAGVASTGAARDVTAEDLLMGADIALYEAKDAGRDRAALAGGIGHGHTWIDEIRAALAEDRFVLYSQPIVEIASGETVREELLIRMVDSAGEIIPPASFIPASERFGLINEIDRWVVRHALELAAEGRRVEVNLSACSLGDRQITRMVAEAVDHGVEPQNVVFEITETAAAANYKEAADFAERLSRIGCGFALDDFGIGFGALSYLKHIPFAYLKIDKEFVRELSAQRQNQRIVDIIVKTAATLGQKTIAEGVEDAAALDVLRELGVDMAQGYHIGRPAPLPARIAARSSGASR